MGESVRTKVALMGYGAINTVVAEAIINGEAGNTALAAVLYRNTVKHRGCADRHPDLIFTDDPTEFLAADAKIVVEAAGQDPTRQLGVSILEQGRDLVVTSIGAFTDDKLFETMCDCARANGGRLLLASGALPGVNWMHSAAMAGVLSATITQIKPVKSWRDTPASDMIDLEALTEPTCFFDGTAREAASAFPKSSNITALLALSTAGLDETSSGPGYPSRAKRET